MRVEALPTGPSHAGLRFVEVLRDRVGGIEGLVQPPGLAISPDGKHVYVAAAGSKAVTAFRRDALTGRLTPLQVQRDGLDAIPRAAPYDIAVSPDGASVYVATFTGSAVAVFGRDPATGRLTYVEAQRHGVGGVDGLLNVRSIAVSPDARHVYTAAVVSSAVAVFAREATTGRLTFVEVQRQGADGLDGLDEVEAVTVSPDGAHVYAVSRASHALVAFARDLGSGRLTHVATRADDCADASASIGLCGGEAAVVSPDGMRIYTADRDGQAVGAFDRDTATGVVAPVAVQHQGENGVDGLTEPLWLAISPDGRHVYVASRGDELGPDPVRPVGNGAVAVFEVTAPAPADTVFDDDGCVLRAGPRPPISPALAWLPVLVLFRAAGSVRAGWKRRPQLAACKWTPRRELAAPSPHRDRPASQSVPAQRPRCLLTVAAVL